MVKTFLCANRTCYIYASLTDFSLVCSYSPMVVDGENVLTVNPLRKKDMFNRHHMTLVQQVTVYTYKFIFKNC